MLTADEKKFLEYWEKNRDKSTDIFRQLRYGLPIGLSIAVLIILNFTMGWYERATMVAFSQSTPFVLLIGIIAIIIFFAVFTKKHRWEMNEQRYKELLFKKGKNEVQQDETNNSQSDK